MKFFFTLATFLAFLPYLLAQPCAIWGCGSSTLQNNCLTFLSSSPQNLITLSQCVTNKECPLSSLTSFLNNLRVYEADNSTANPGVVPCQFRKVLGSYCESNLDCLSLNCTSSLCIQGTKLSGTACTDSSECVSNICENSVCSPLLSQYTKCNITTDHCQNNLVCRKFPYCTPRSSLGSSCSADSDCESNYCSGNCRALTDNSCTVKNDCPTQSRALSPFWFQYCDDNSACQVSLTSIATCNADKQCITLHCRSNRCQFLEGITPCSSNSDCLQTEYYCGDGFCRLRLYSGNCTGDAMCAAKSRLCINGSCVAGNTAPDTRACTQNSECPSPYFYCSSNICTAKRSSGFSCTADQQCQSHYCKTQDSSQTCTLDMSDKQCTPDDNNLSGHVNECLNLDKDYYYCNKSTSLCTSKGLDSSSTCSQNAQCMYNQCISKTCKPTTDKPCFTDTNCPNGYYCEVSITPRKCKSVLSKVCTVTSDCAPYGIQYQCNSSSGLCEQLTITGTCANDADCNNSNFFCDLTSQCRPKNNRNYPCSTDSECIDTLKCFNTACQTAIPSGSSCEQSEECESHSLYCKDTNADSIRDTCSTKEATGQACGVYSDCAAGHICYNQICVAFLSISVGTQFNSSLTDTPSKLNLLCGNALLIDSMCSSLIVLTSASTATFPYLCTVGNVCEYRRTTGIQDTYVSHQCECGGVDNVKGFCKIVLGMPEYTTALQSLLALLPYTSNCPNDYQYSLSLEHLLSSQFKNCATASISLFNTAHERYFEIMNNPQIQNCQINSCISRLPLHPSTFDSQSSYSASCSVSIPIGLYQNEPLSTTQQVIALREDLLTGDTTATASQQTANKTVALNRFLLTIDSTISNQVYSQILTTLYDAFVFDSFNLELLCSQYKDVLKALSQNVQQGRLTEAQVLSKGIGAVNNFLQSRDTSNSNCVSNFKSLDSINSFFFQASSQIQSFTYSGTQIHASRNTHTGSAFSLTLSSGASVIIPSSSQSEILSTNNLSTLKSNIYQIEVSSLVGQSASFLNTLTKEAIIVDLWTASYSSLSVSNLAEPIEVKFQLNSIDASGNLACAAWNIDRWDTSGIETSTESITASLSSVICKSPHLSTFSVINFASSSALTNYIRGIIFVSILVATFLILFFVTVKVNFKHQALTNRFSEARDNLFFESGNIDMEGTYDDLRNDGQPTHRVIGQKLEVKMAVLQHYSHLSKRYSCCQLFVTLLFYRMPLISILQYDHVLTTFFKLLILYMNICVTSLILCLIARQDQDLSYQPAYYAIALVLGYLYVPNSFLYICKTASVGGEGRLISLGKALLFELARVAERVAKINNRSPNKDTLNSSMNRADLSSLGDVTLNFFGKDESAKTVKLVFQDYKMRTYSKSKNLAAMITISLLCVICLILIILQYPQTDKGRSRFITAVMVCLLCGIFLWSLLKIMMGTIVLHRCRRKRKGKWCVNMWVDAASLVVFNDLPVG